VSFAPCRFFLPIVAIASGLLATPPPSRAQIVPDGTLPVSTTISVDGSALSISGGTIVGNNLFHSFESFSVPADTTARFEIPAGLTDGETFAIGRITGSAASQIDGTLSASAPTSLVLVNPNGIFFSSTARLDIGGSFLATTADRLLFDDGVALTADSPTPLLTVGVPVGVQFNGGNGAIGLSGNGTVAEDNETFTTIGITGDGLVVEPDRLVSLVASEVSLDGALLAAPRGSVFVAGIERGTAILRPDGRFDISGIEAAGDVRFDNASAIDTADPEGSGSIDVVGRNVSFVNGSTLFTRVIDRGFGQGITLTATETLDFGGLSPTGGNSAIIAGSLRDGDGSDISISAGRVRLRDGGVISSGTGGGAGDAGDVTIVARESIEATGVGRALPTAILAVVGNNATGNGGDITIDAQRVALTDGALISAGGVDISRGGNVTVRADEIEIRGTGVTELRSWTSGIGASVSSNARGLPSSDENGLGGSITLVADRITLDDGAELVATALVENDANPEARGAAGNISITADRLTINDGSTISTEAASGDRGNVLLDVNDLRLLGSSSIEASATSIASGGSIAIEADTLALLGFATIRADAEQSFAGRVSIEAEGIFIDAISAISAESALGESFRGSVSLETPDLDTQNQVVRFSTDFAPPDDSTIGSQCEDDRGVFYVTGSQGVTLSNEFVMRPIVWTPQRRTPRAEYPAARGLTAPATAQEATSWERDRDRIALVGDRPTALPSEGCRSARHSDATSDNGTSAAEESRRM